MKIDLHSHDGVAHSFALKGREMYILNVFEFNWDGASLA